MSVTTAKSAARRLSVGNIELSPGSYVLSGPRGHVQLSVRYFRVMARLLREPGVLVLHTHLISAMYPNPDSEPDNGPALLRQTIVRLRGVIEVLAGQQVMITTVAGVGYRVHVRGS